MDAIDWLQIQEDKIPEKEKQVRPFTPGTFGVQKITEGVVFCLECDTEIPLARLKALPDATLCKNCAEQQEEHMRRFV